METYGQIFTFLSIAGGIVVSLLAALPIALVRVYAAFPTQINLAIFVLGTSLSIALTFQAIYRYGERSRDHRVVAGLFTNARLRLEILGLQGMVSYAELTALL